MLQEPAACTARPAAAAASPPASARKRAATAEPPGFEWADVAASGELKRHRGDSSSPAASAGQQPACVPSPGPAPSPQHEQQRQPDKLPPLPALPWPAPDEEAAAAAAAAVEPAVSAEPAEQGPAQEPAALPDWCDRALQGERDEDAEPAPFCLLPGHPLLALACEGQAELLAKVLEQGAHPDARDSRGLTGAQGGPRGVAGSSSSRTM